MVKIKFTAALFGNTGFVRTLHTEVQRAFIYLPRVQDLTSEKSLTLLRLYHEVDKEI